MLAFLLGTAIGVMFVLSVAEMWIHNAIEHGWSGVTLAMLCGALLYQLLSPFIPNFDSAAELSAVGGETTTGSSLIGGRESGKLTAIAGKAVAKAVLDGNGSGSLPSHKAGLVPRRFDNVGLESAQNGHHANGMKKESINGNGSGSLAVAGVAVEDEDEGGKPERPGRRSSELLRLGFLMAVTMTLHNAPEGFAGKEKS